MDAPRTPCILDTSVLINFLAVDRVDLLASYPRFRFHITPHVHDEVTKHYLVQVERLHRALANGALEVTRVEGLAELAMFAKLEADGFGPGDSAVIAAAVNRRWPLAIQDRNAHKRAAKFEAGLLVLTTESIVLDHLRAGTLTLDAAEGLRIDWETRHKFKIRGSTFAALLGAPPG